ncbi:hypothetical protein [Natrialba sp. INN-245]|uniref:hypothetical protein n=1 Tax=Natrialba sp. INN-245 TaxID=2690967 RepID=UPI001313B25D|nr:hypothetical protein [Natrialba sp. INN-245]MWV41053.1 hypothetical protein [Natrialba sp. INN-245]
MVSPHDNWEDVEDGYRNGNIGVFVEPAYIEDEGGVLYSRVGVTESDTNAYLVSYQSGLETGYGSHKELINFEDPRAAWEYANLVTHYLEYGSDEDLSISELQGRSDPTEDTWHPKGVVSEMRAEEVMRKMLGHYEFRLNDALKASEVVGK